MTTATNPRHVTGWPYQLDAPHGITQAQLDAAPGGVLVVRVDADAAIPIALADGVNVAATHLVSGLRGDSTVELRELDQLGAISVGTGLTRGTDYYPDAATPGHLSATRNGPRLLTYLGGASAQGRVASDAASSFVGPVTNGAANPFDLHTKAHPYRRSVAIGTHLTNQLIAAVAVAHVDFIWQYTPFTEDGQRGGWIVEVPELTGQVSTVYAAVHNGATATAWKRVVGKYSGEYTVAQIEAFFSAGIEPGGMFWLRDVGKLVIWHPAATSGDYQPTDGGPGFFEVLVDSDAIQDPVDTRALDPATLTIATAPAPYRVLISTNPDGAATGQWATDNAHNKIATTVDDGATWTYYQPEANDFVEVVDANIAGGEAPYATYTTTNGWVDAQGDVAENLPVLELIEVTVTGYVTSVTLAADLVLTDGAGNLYDSADWRIVSDDSDGVETTPIVSGTVLNGAVFSPPRNNDRTIGIVFAGNTVRSGLSAVTLQLRPGIGPENTGTTGLTAVKARYFTGDVELFSASGGQPGVQTYTFPAPFKFLTHPQVSSTETNVWPDWGAADGVMTTGRKVVKAEVITLPDSANSTPVPVHNTRMSVATPAGMTWSEWQTAGGQWQTEGAGPTTLNAPNTVAGDSSDTLVWQYDLSSNSWSAKFGSDANAAGTNAELGEIDQLIDASPDNTTIITTYDFALGMTYGAFKTRYGSMRISLGYNNLWIDAISESYVLDDFAAGTDLALLEYTVHGSNAYHIKATVPVDNATTMRLYAEGSAGFYRAILRATEKPVVTLADGEAVIDPAVQDGDTLTIDTSTSPPTLRTAPVLRTYTVSTTWTGGLSNSNFPMGPFQVESSGVYQYTMNAQGADTQGSRVSYNFEVRDAANGGGNQIASSYLSVNTGAGASNQTFDLPQAQGTVTLEAGTDYWVFGDRNTGGLFTGNRWTLELTGP